MFVNLDRLPAGKSMFTVAVTDAPVGTPSADLYYEEVDVVAPTNSGVGKILETADLSEYDETNIRVIGVINQSAGFVLADTVDGDLLTGEEW